MDPTKSLRQSKYQDPSQIYTRRYENLYKLVLISLLFKVEYGAIDAIKAHFGILIQPHLPKRYVFAIFQSEEHLPVKTHFRVILQSLDIHSHVIAGKLTLPLGMAMRDNLTEFY